MSRPKPAVVLIPALLLVLGVTSYLVERQRNSQRSVLSGFFESQPSEASSRIQGRVSHIYVNEGEMVHAGQTLVLLETSALFHDTAVRIDQADQARQNLAEVDKGPRIQEIQRQQAVVAEAKANLTKLRNGPLPEEIAEAQARLKHAESQYQKVRAGPREQEIAEARAAERTAAAKLAQSERGLTPQEHAEARARFESAQAQERLARRDAERYEELFKEDAVSRQQADQKLTDLSVATAKRREMEEALRLADLGTPREEMDQARQSHNQAVAALDLVLAGSRREDISSALADLMEARKALQLLARGSRSEDLQASKDRLDAAQAALDELLAGSRKEQIKQAQAAASAAASTARSARINLSENTIKSPIDGIVERIPVAVGDLVNPGTTVVRLSNPVDLWLRIYVPETNLRNVVVGSAAKIKIDGISDLLPAYVESVASQGEFTPANLQTPDDRGKQVFGVRLRLLKANAAVKAGMSATVKQVGGWTP